MYLSNIRNGHKLVRMRMRYRHRMSFYRLYTTNSDNGSAPASIEMDTDKEVIILVLHACK